MHLFDLHEPLMPLFAEAVRWADWPLQARLLDLGCGEGLKTDLLAASLNAQGQIIAIDIDEKALNRAAQRSYDWPCSIVWQCADAHALPFADRTFKAVWCSALLAALPDPNQVWREVRRVLQPHGSLLVITARHAWAAVHNWPAELLRALQTAYAQALANGDRLAHQSELTSDLCEQLQAVGFARVEGRAFMCENPQLVPLGAELLLMPWDEIEALLQAYLPAELLDQAERYTTPPEEVELVSMMVVIRARV